MLSGREAAFRSTKSADNAREEIMEGKIFLKAPYMGADNELFREEFVLYLEQVLKNNLWDAMSDYILYLQGAKKAIEEIIGEIKNA